MAKKLSGRQNRFVYAIVEENLTPPKAAIAAGYSESNAPQAACRLMHNEAVKQAIADARKDRAKRTGVTEDYVIARLVEIVERVGAKESDVIKALDLLGKNIGMWEKQTTDDNQVRIVISSELEEWAK